MAPWTRLALVKISPSFLIVWEPSKLTWQWSLPNTCALMCALALPAPPQITGTLSSQLLNLMKPNTQASFRELTKNSKETLPLQLTWLSIEMLLQPTETLLFMSMQQQEPQPITTSSIATLTCRVLKLLWNWKTPPISAELTTLATASRASHAISREAWTATASATQACSSTLSPSPLVPLKTTASRVSTNCSRVGPLASASSS